MRAINGMAYERSARPLVHEAYTHLGEDGALQKPSVAMAITVLKPVNVPKYMEFIAN